MHPVDVQPVGETELLISWQDAHRSLYTYEYLRFNCPCASCRDEWSGERRIRLGSIPKDIKPSEILPVGRYAFRFRWSDGHETGIYGYDFLREICPCETCQKNRVKKS